jgi:hypothetical protein
MSEFEIDFEWPVAEKYELRPATPKEINERRRGPWAQQMLRGVPETEWPLYLAWIVPVGKLKDHRPKTEKLEGAVRVLAAGLDSKKVPFHTIAFRVAQSLGGKFREHSEGIVSWYVTASRLRMLFEGKQWLSWEKEHRWPHSAAQEVGELGIYLVPDKDGKPVLALRPQDIEEALVLCAARMRATGTTFNICGHCKGPFLSGGTRFRNKRGDARFCSDECRWKFHNESRRKAR